MLKKESFRENVVAGTVSGLVLLVVSGIIALIPGAWALVVDAVEKSWTHLWGTSWLPNCIVYPMMLFCGWVLVLYLFHIRDNMRSNNPTISDYLQDTIVGIAWRWSYQRKTRVNLIAFCPVCDMQLVYDTQHVSVSNQATSLSCERCRRTFYTAPGTVNHLLGMVGREIERKIRNGEWKNHVAKPSPPVPPS